MIILYASLCFGLSGICFDHEKAVAIFGDQISCEIYAAKGMDEMLATLGLVANTARCTREERA